MPAVVAVQLVIMALPGDSAHVGPLQWLWFFIVAALSWAAAVRRSSLAWLWLLGLFALSLVWSLVSGIESDYDPAAYPYMLLTVVALALLLARDSLAHVRE